VIVDDVLKDHSFLPKYFVLTACFLALNPAGLSGQTIATVAGNGILTWNGDGGQATAAGIGYPEPIFADGVGNIYFGDDHDVRKISTTTGIITTVAGNGTVGYNGDGVQATAAQTGDPEGLAFDSAGNLYFSEYINNRVRKVDMSTGIISTVAGIGTLGYNGDGIQGTAAELNHPIGLIFNSAGNLLISDKENNRIRTLNMTTGVITTVAGTGVLGYNGDGIQSTAANISEPYRMAFDSAGNLYISEYYNRVRKINMTTGIINTVAGNGISGYTGDGIPATAAELYFPWDIKLDGMDNLYIADANNNRVRKVDAISGTITTIAGTGTAGYNGDGILATSAKLDFPAGLSFNCSGDLLISDENGARVRSVNLLALVPTCILSATNTSTTTVTGSATPTPIATGTATMTPSATQTRTATTTSTGTPTYSLTTTDVFTSTPTFTSTPNSTLTSTASVTPTLTRSHTLTPSMTFTSSQTPTLSLTTTQTLSPSESATMTLSLTKSQTLTSSLTLTMSKTPTRSLTITPTITSSQTLTPSETLTPIPPEEFYIYPSPATGDTAWVVYTMKESGVAVLLIYTSGADLADKIEEPKPAGNQKTSISINRFASGTYFCILRRKYYSGWEENHKPKKFLIER